MAGSYSDCYDNIILLTDSYKVTHHRQYPDGITLVSSYFESRGGKFAKVVFFGLQYILKRWLCGPVVTAEKIMEAKEFYKLHFGAEVFNEKGWTYILEKHGGMLPLRVKAVPEGSVIPTKNVLFTVENTDPNVPWITNWFETLFVQVWYPTTVATNSWHQKELIAKYLSETADNLNGLPFKLHDFGFRGSSSVESAGIGGASHLVNFQGTDTLAGISMARKFYGCKMAGISIPAAEHSTITTWGKDGEREAFRNMLDQFPRGLVAVVSDSYDIFNACKNLWGTELRELVVQRGETGSVLVIRPDSGEPVDMVIKVLTLLGEAFGTVKNSKGYRLLPPYLRVIQGDGICHEMIDAILGAMQRLGWSADNVGFGSGGALLQRLDRDTLKCAFKCSRCIIDGEAKNVYKDPVTDPGKKSKKGRLTLQKENGTYRTYEEGKGDPNKDLLELVYENGELVKEQTFEEIRERAEIDIVKNASKRTK